ncbi:MAG TPA: outer membrane lipoprotein chaperone LolA [Steroidobacteraceae bacterium]|jgi:outer membrane lipoprotein carrier protein
MSMLRGWSVALLMLLGQVAWGASTPLDSYLEGMKTLRATFVQTLVDAHGRQIDRSTGTLIVERPGKFSWEIHPQGSDATAGQLMVADGRNLWFLDRDLQQVTVKPMDAVLSATPMMLLSGTGDVRKNFAITPEDNREGLEWVRVEPHGSQADFRRAELGFAAGELRRMVLDDKLGQQATVVFDHVERNGHVAPEEVSFTPPAGVDVIGTPRQ